MDFALERKFLDPYHSGRDEVDNIEDSRAKEENTGAKYLHSYLGMENAVITEGRDPTLSLIGSNSLANYGMYVRFYEKSVQHVNT